MQNINILSEDEVFKKGIEFDGEVVCFSGIHGVQVYNQPMEEGGEPVTGLVYEKYNNGHIAYYSYYENGIKNGECVRFYESSKIKEYYIMQNGQIFGEYIEWYENGIVKSLEYHKYGLVVSYQKWNENGNLIDKKTGLTDSEKISLGKREALVNSSKNKKNGKDDVSDEEGESEQKI